MTRCPVCDEILELRPILRTESGWACVVCNAPFVDFNCALNGAAIDLARQYWAKFYRPVWPSFFEEPEAPIETYSDLRNWNLWMENKR